MTNDYLPISCAFYDELESAAVKRLDCEIVYLEDDKEKTVNAKVVDFKSKEKQEFMVLDNKQMIRLDKIVLFNGIAPSDKNYC